MSELINTNDNHATIHWKLLTGASALALTAYVVTSGAAMADDADHGQLWIEFGGQMELLQGFSAPVIAPFMTVTPTPDIYKGFPFADSQRAPRFAFGEEGKISWQPENSDWIFSAGIRYGRSHANKHTHKQAAAPPILFTKHYSAFGYPGTYPPYLIYPTKADLLADTKAHFQESHLVLDFTAGKDVGLGLFGREGTSTINAGVRIASFTAHSEANISGRPAINIPTGRYITKYYGFIRIEDTSITFDQYRMQAHAQPASKVCLTLSWDASAALAGNEQDGELTFDWGINAALLFGKQRAKATTKRRHTIIFRRDGLWPRHQLPRHIT